MSIVEAIPYCVIGLMAMLIGVQFVRSALTDRKNKKNAAAVLENIYHAEKNAVNDEVKNVDNLDSALDRLGGALRLAESKSKRYDVGSGSKEK